MPISIQHRRYLFSLSVCMLSACIKTDALVGAFNGGALDTSAGDPDRDPQSVAKDLVVDRIRQELGDGYFGQGSSGSAYVATWMERAATHAFDFTGQVVARACLEDAAVGNLCRYRNDQRSAEFAASSGADSVQQARASVRRDARGWTDDAEQAALHQNLCGPDRDEAQRRFADFVRFESAVERAVRAVASLMSEGLVNAAHVHQGARQAFTQSAQYLRDRGWQRSLAHPTLGLVVKGGAATGVFSAGVVWTVLNMINECARDPECSAAQPDARFKMISGTSTGALVSTVVDRYNSSSDYQGRNEERARLATWFTCSAMNDLYCVRSAPILNLAREQDSLLEFDGLTALLRQHVKCSLMTNPSELIFNTVDFRSGRLFALSDQERFSLRTPEDVVQAALASAVLPVIARPVGFLPANPDPRRAQTYLDGGIRSEIPILPLARRGAERVLVVASASSVPVGTTPLLNAAQIAARYVDVSLAGVIENDLALTQSHVESVRLSERETCLDELAGKYADACQRDQGCSVEAVCSARWKQTCDESRPAEAPAIMSDSEHVTQDLAERLRPVWRMVGVFRNESRVEPLHGYTFEPEEQRRLFLAGAEAVRGACIQIARLLDIPVGESGSSTRRRLISWCAPELPAQCPPRSPENANVEPKVCVDKPIALDDQQTRDCRAAVGGGGT